MRAPVVSEGAGQLPNIPAARVKLIESIVAAMEAGQLPLEQSLAAYKRGAELLKYCQAQLQEAQQQVKVLEAGTLQNFSGDNGNE